MKEQERVNETGELEQQRSMTDVLLLLAVAKLNRERWPAVRKLLGFCTLLQYGGLKSGVRQTWPWLISQVTETYLRGNAIYYGKERSERTRANWKGAKALMRAIPASCFAS
jgi:hypothetical protein